LRTQGPRAASSDDGRNRLTSWAAWCRRPAQFQHRKKTRGSVIMVLRGVAAVLAATVSHTLRNWAIVRVNGDISAFLITVAFAATLSQSAFAADSGVGREESFAAPG